MTMQLHDDNIKMTSAFTQLNADDATLSWEHRRRALDDIVETWKRRWLVIRLAWEDVAKRYRGAILGPFWVTIGLSVKIGTLAAIYPGIMATDRHSYVPFTAIGFIVWNFISGVISEGTHAFISSAPIIRQIRLPYLLHVAQLIVRNLIVLAHNLVVYIVVALIFTITPSIYTLTIIPGLVLLCWNGAWIALLLGMLCIRFRDLPEAVNSVLMVFFFVTPIFWQPKEGQVHKLVLLLNPFYHAVEVIRAPLLGDLAPGISWLFLLCSAIIGTAISGYFFHRFRGRIAFWA